ncbi:hypothetical protein E4U53_004979 [Claviceps sorghi]|nr:hypothetical protein E4U53_004979 [Claviceps sorghi]
MMPNGSRASVGDCFVNDATASVWKFRRGSPMMMRWRETFNAQGQVVSAPNPDARRNAVSSTEQNTTARSDASQQISMSFFGIGRQQPTSEQKIAAVEGEMRMMADTYNRLQKTCQKKCIPTDYREGELNKGESVCLDRCTAKFLDTSMKVSEIMQQQGQALGGQASGGSGGLF